MNIDYSPEERRFQEEVRAWMRENAPSARHGVQIGIPMDKQTHVAWERRLAAKGWLAYFWPKEYGGPGWSATQRHIFDEERAAAGAPQLSPFGLSMLGPVLMAFGNDAQKQRYLPKIAAAEEYWCQGYSEPGAGSDLAGLKTRAQRQGDHYLVNGQKIWTTHAHWADFMFCLVRTDASVAKQQGISFLLIDMKSPGVEVRPIITIDGHHHLNEVFLTDVKVPVENLVGQEGQGWTIAKYLLTFERTSIAGVADSKYEISRLKEVARRDRVDGQALIDQPGVRERIAELEIDLLALEYTNFRTLDRVARGAPPGAESSGLKIAGTELQQAISEAMVEFGGYDALPWLPEQPVGEPAYNTSTIRYNFLRASSIYGGSNEIQKNVIAKLVLGLG
jgi:alkylation response protein AidB-like acyl-CoA dehydrogenase